MKKIKIDRNIDGFTLIELLAVILILGIIALIAIPMITNIIADVEKSSVRVSMQNLIDAGEKYYMRIQYDDTSCIDVNNPDLDFDNKLGSITGFVCYDDDKNEAYLSDVIYEDYIFNGTTDNLVLSEIDRSIKPVYTLEEEVFDGVDDYYDTGYALFDEAKDFTIVVSLTSNSTTTTANPPTVFHCMKEVSPYPGLALDHQNANGRIAASQNVLKIFPQPIKGNKNVLVVKRTATDNKQTYYVFNSEGEIVSANFTLRSDTFNQHLLVGAYQDTSGVKGRFYTGTIHYFGLYMEALDDVTIKSIMNDLK